MIMVSLAVFGLVFFWGGGPASHAASGDTSNATTIDQTSAHFPICSKNKRVTCIVDGDTFWFRGEKIRIADINTPEVTSPKCAAEAELGARATNRLQELMNEGPFTLSGTAHDRYGRALKTVLRGGHSLGATLVDEGLAENWRGYKRNWR